MSWIIMSQYFKIIKRTVPGTISATCLHAQSLVCVRLLATPWTVACQVPLSMGFPGKNTGVGCHFLLQGIFPTQGLNPGLLYCMQILYHLSHQGSPSDLLGIMNFPGSLPSNNLLVTSPDTITDFYSTCVF